MSVVRRVHFFLVSSLFSVSEKSEKDERQRARGFRRHAVALGAVLILVGPQGWAQGPPPGGPAVTLAIEVSLPDRAVFYIPVVGDGEVPGIVPLPNGRFAGIRITPRMRADSVQIEASALITSEKRLSEATCDEVRSWNSEDAGSYDGKENASLLLSGLGRLGLPVFEVKVVGAGGPPPGGGHHPYAHFLAFCGCEYPKPRSIIDPDGSSASGVAGIMSYPDAGKCVQISGCGQCCRTAVPASLEQEPMEPDQENIAGWDKAWTNLLSVAEQSFTPSLPKLLGVEVELVVGNPGEAKDELTLTIMDANNKELAVVTEQVQAANSERVMFLMPTEGVELSPGLTYRLRLTGGALFGWKYVAGGYKNGEATFNGRPLLRDARSTFLFRTFGVR